MRILIAGVNGFVGQHLVRELKARGHEITGVGLDEQATPETNGPLSDYRQCDLADPGQVGKLPLDNMDAVINLAGLANAGASFAAAEKYKKLNVAMLSVLGEQLLKISSRARVIAISTGAVYAADQPMPLTEKSKTIKQGSPYAESKLMMEEAGHELKKRGLDCVIVRPFNHAGPGQLPGFLIPDLYAKLVQAKKTGQPVKVGNLKTKRDYTDVRDVVKAYADLAEAEELEFDTYNVCSGTSRSGQEVLDLFLKKLDLAGKVHVEIDEALIRPDDPLDMYGSYERINQETGWKPTIPFEQTIADFIACNDSL